MMIMKKLTSIEVIEEQGLKVKENDLKTVIEHLEKEIVLTYDENLKVWNEGGQYIADLIDCN
jgi:hypothetical protein